MVEPTENRLQRRKQRTRTALIEAAKDLLAADRLNVAVLEITQAADVGLGSFYNHFDSKEQLFAAAIADVLETHGALLDQFTAALDDPAERFACSYRITGRLFRRSPQLCQVLLANGLKLISSDSGLAPRGRRDIAEAVAIGRFSVDDQELAVAAAGGALMGLGQLLRDEPGRDAALAADQLTEDLLRMFGLSAEDAHEICQRPLPDISALPAPDSAA